MKKTKTLIGIFVMMMLITVYSATAVVTNADILNYITFDNIASLSDLKGGMSPAIQGDVLNTAGVQSNAGFLDKANDNTGKYITTNGISGSTKAIAFWYYQQSTPTNSINTIMYGAGGNNALYYFEPSTQLTFSGGQSIDGAFATDTPQYIILQEGFDGNTRVFIDNVERTFNTPLTWSSFGIWSAGLNMLSDNGGSGSASGWVDEFITLNRVPTSAERTQMRNSGAGLTYANYSNTTSINITKADFVHYFRLEDSDNVTDEKGKLSGTNVNAVADATGRVGNSLYLDPNAGFDGTYIEMNGSLSSGIKAFGFWYNRMTGGGGASTLFSQVSGDEMELGTSTGGLHDVWFEGGSIETNPTFKFTDDNWHLVIVNLNNASQILDNTVYVDNYPFELTGGVTFTIGGTLYLMNHVDNGFFQQMYGKLDELFYVDENVDATQRARIYNAGSGRAYSFYADGGEATPIVYPPVITSFNATNITILNGTSTTLAWNIINATTRTINNGVGSVTATNSTSVSPNTNITYILNATNSNSSVYANVTIIVTYPIICTPDYYCSHFFACASNNNLECDTVGDLNNCGVNYTGSAGDFNQSCVYSAPTTSTPLLTSDKVGGFIAEGLFKFFLGFLAVLSIIVIVGLVGFTYSGLKGRK